MSLLLDGRDISFSFTENDGDGRESKVPDTHASTRFQEVKLCVANRNRRNEQTNHFANCTLLILYTSAHIFASTREIS